MVNESHGPSTDDEKVLWALKEGREQGDPRGCATRVWIREQTGLDEGSTEYSLRNLHNAGWIDRPARGLDEFVDDPREN